jgi:hypothetical protein
LVAELCLVIFAAFFFLDPLAGSVAVAGVVAEGVVVDTAGDVAGAGVGVVAMLGAALVFGLSSARTGAAGKHTNMTAAAAAAIQDSVFIRNSNVSDPNVVKVMP